KSQINPDFAGYMKHAVYVQWAYIQNKRAICIAYGFLILYDYFNISAKSIIIISLPTFFILSHGISTYLLSMKKDSEPLFSGTIRDFIFPVASSSTRSQSPRYPSFSQSGSETISFPPNLLNLM